MSCLVLSWPLTIGSIASSQLLLVLHATILEPRLDLCLAQTQGSGQFHALGRREVTLRLEALLQPRQLWITEDGACLATPAVAQRIHSHAQSQCQFRHAARRPKEG